MELSSDLEEVQNVVDVAFGEMSYKIEEFAKTSIEKFGMSKLAAKDTASSFMAMAKGMQLPSEAASDMSLQLTALSADMASFFNVAQSETRTALASVYTGETETLKRYGILMTEVNLQEYARQQGIEKSISAMTQQEKVLLRYNYVMNATRLSQGDFARTSESWANQTRILKEQWKEFLAVLGQGLIQVLAPVVRFLSSAMTYMMALARAVNEVMASVFGFNMNLIDSTSGVSSGAVEASDSITEVGDAAEKAGKKAAKAVAPFDKLNEVANAEVTGNPLQAIDSFNPAGAIEAGGAIGAISKNIDDMDSKIKKMADEIKPVLQGIVDVFEKFAPAIAGIAAAFITHKVVDWFGKLASAIGVFSLGPAGIIAIAIGALVAIGIGLKKLRDDAIEADLEKRFGDISLSLEEIETIAERLTTSKYSANIDVFVTEKQKLEQIEKGIKADVETLNKLDWKVSVGLALTEGEISQYKSTIESFIANSNDYIDQQQYIVSLALQATITNDGNFLSEMTTAANLYYDATRGEMEALGKKLREAYDLAFADGVLDSKEQELIWNIRKEMTDVMQKAADLEFQAQLKKLAIDYGDTELTAESWEALTEKIQEFNKTRLDGLEEAELVGIQSIMMRYNLRLDEAKNEEERKKITAEMEGVLAQYAQEVSQTEATITLQGIDVQYDTLLGNYKDGLDGAREVLGQELKDWLSEDWYSQYIGSPIENTIGGMVSDVQLMVEEAISSSGLDRAGRKGLEGLLEGLSPTRDDYKEKYDEALKTGNQVHQGLNDSLSSDMALRALAGQMDGIWYLMGQKLSTDPVFLEALSKAENAGVLLNEDIIRGLKSKVPELKKTGDKLIFDLDGAISNASKTAGKTTIPTSAGAIIGGFGNKFTKDKTTKSAVKTWLDGINDTIKNYKLSAVKVRAEFFGLELPGITGKNQNYLKYPQYASGNVIPANYGNFLATLGDNKREPEVVSPVSTIKQAVREAIAEMGGAGGGDPAHYTVKINNKAVFEGVVQADREYKKSVGRSAFYN